MAAAAVGVASRARRSSGSRGVAFCRWTNGLLHPRFVFPEAAAVAGSGAGSAQDCIALRNAIMPMKISPYASYTGSHSVQHCAFCVKRVLRMVLNKVLELFCVKKKDSKKKVAAPHPTANVSTNNSLLDPFSTGNGTVLSVQKHEPECSSVISSMTRTEYGFESDGCNLFSHFDVVQDFSDHYYAKNSPGKTSKDWVKTIQNEWRLLQKDLPESIYVRVYEDRIDLLRAAIVGPAETPYHDGLFFFDVCFPSEYPQSHRLTHVHIPSLMSYESPMHACHGKWSSIPSSVQLQA
uniref:Ubiquitin-conjugating enzyme family protein, expressed n=1 Tax=Oryza sativa subsp. japonica TaxID=39947 RepID=Q10F67_ORYSJ|nr:Ubiquitin-conjugating enzyme family protein, expressed [Oryza sativa Japonica Group]